MTTRHKEIEESRNEIWKETLLNSENPTDDFLSNPEVIQIDKSMSRIDIEIERLKDILGTSTARKEVLAEIILRNIRYLQTVKRKVFITGPFEGNDAAGWLKDVGNLIEEYCNIKDFGKVEIVFGIGRNSGDIALEILERMAQCHYYVAIIPPDSFYCIEEAAAVVPLAKPFVIATERNLDSEKVGQFLGSQWKKIDFELPAENAVEADSEWKRKLAEDIVDGLITAEIRQKARMSEIRDIVKPAFAKV